MEEVEKVPVNVHAMRDIQVNYVENAELVITMTKMNLSAVLSVIHHVKDTAEDLEQRLVRFAKTVTE